MTLSSLYSVNVNHLMKTVEHKMKLRLIKEMISTHCVYNTGNPAVWSGYPSKNVFVKIHPFNMLPIMFLSI